MLAITFIEFIIGCLLHFAYDVFPNYFIGFIAPINESIFEHLKIAFYPMLIVNIAIIVYKRDKSMLFSMFIGMITAMLSIILIYYPLVYGFDIISLAADVTLLFIADWIGNAMGYHFYKHKNLPYQLAVILIIVTIIVLCYLTYHPLDISLFI